MGEQQDTQHQRGGFARTGTGDHRGGRRVAEDHLPLGGAGLRVSRQQACHIGLDAFFQIGREGQPPIIEQVVIHPRRTVFFRAEVANQQDLPAFFDAVGLALAIAVLHTRLVPTAKTVGLPMQPGKPVLCAQAGQAMPEQAGGEPFQPWHFGQGAQFRGQIRLLLRHADSCDELGVDECAMVAGIAA